MRTILLLLLVSSEVFGACATTWANGYSKCVEITLDHTKVANTDQTNFPNLACFNGATGANCDAALGTLTLAALKLVGSGGSATSSSCFDCIFTSDNAGTTKLKWDTDVYVGTSGSAIFHVQKTRSHTVDDKVYLFIGNASVTTFQGDESMWNDASYVTVHHLSALDGTTLSGANSVTGTKTQDLTNQAATTTTGFIGGAVSLAVEQYMSATGAGSGNNYPGGVAAWTASLWSKTTQNPGFATMFTWGWNTGDNMMAFFLANGPGTGQFGMATSSHGCGSLYPPAINDGAWHYLTTSNSTGSLVNKVYFDGVLKATCSAVFAISNSFGGLFVGRVQDASIGAAGQFIGIDDEVRIATVQRSDDWITTEYNNQHSPSTFYSAAAATGQTAGVKHRVISQ